MCYCTVFTSFYFAFEGNFPVEALWSLHSKRQFNGGFFALRVWERGLILEGLIRGGAYFRNFAVYLTNKEA